MRGRDALALLLLVGLGVAAAVLAARVARHHEVGGRLRLEVGRVKLARLEPETRARLAALDDRLVLTYYVSDRARMPSSMKRVEAGVTDLLRAMEAAAPGRVEYHVVDPDTDPDLVGYASKRRVAPFRVRSVSRDSWSERLVWSALTISYGTHPEAVIGGIGPDHLPRLQATIVEHLDQMLRPRPPVLALAAPPGFEGLRAALAEHGEVVDADLDGGEAFPADADVLFWMRPRVVTPARLREVERFLASGRSLVVAASEWELPPDGISAADGAPALRLASSGSAAEALYADLGLRVQRVLVLDERADAISWPKDAPAGAAEARVAAPFLLRCIAPNQDWMRWRLQPNGTLLFQAPTPLALAPEVLAARGYEAEVLATSSDDTWVQPPPLDAPRPFALLAREHGEPASKLPLVVALRPADPWAGLVVAFAAATPFEDGWFRREGAAHERLVDVLLRDLAADERLVAASAELDRPAPLPALGPAARLGWRAAGILLVPALLAAVALARGAHRTGGERRTRGGRERGARTLVPHLALGLAAALLVARAAAPAPLLVDATEEDLSRLAPETRAIAAAAGADGPIRVELVISDRERLPPALRPLVGRLRGALRDLERAGARLDVVTLDPDDLDDAERASLEADGVRQVQVATRDEETVTVRTITAAARLGRDGRTAVLPLSEPADFEDLEFRLAFALWRLTEGREPVVAFAADAKRPSAAESYEEYQQQGLFAPQGTDRYSVARRLLERSGFRTVNVTPRDFMGTPDVPDDADALVWMQPRRSIEAMLEETVRYLVGGGDVLVAAQHFNIQSRQFRGRGFRMSYWPQPQTPDVDLLYFPEIGVELVREVLFDELSFEDESDAKIAGRGRAREYDRQASARPFQIRASAANFADHPMMRGIGDQAFLWASPIRLDRERLAELGLEATVLATTSPRSWTFAWKGGYLEDAEGSPLAGPPTDESGAPLWAGRLPLAVLVEGKFPRPEKPFVTPVGLAGAAAAEDDAAAAEGSGAPWPDPAPGRLLLVGSSEVFTDRLIRGPEFRGDHLLLSGVAHLALPPDLAALAARRPVARGFDYVEPETRLRWRSTVLAAPPLAILLLALAWRGLRASRPRTAADAYRRGEQAPEP